jgi:hypothetical protein
MNFFLLARNVAMTDRELLLRLAGVVQLGILLASFLVPRVLDWRDSLRSLPKLSRNLIWVHGAFIVLIIVGFGLLTIVEAAGTPLARAVCTLMGLFWLARLGVQFFVFDASPFLTSRFLRLGYYGLTVAFLYLSVVYGWSALA